ncbi:MAG: hypothetical protein FWC43_08660 [Planctomycetaceae bacterium]|nr:hypothetical protein [Planctomycetaceae bacterium]
MIRPYFAYRFHRGNDGVLDETVDSLCLMRVHVTVGGEVKAFSADFRTKNHQRFLGNRADAAFAFANLLPNLLDLTAKRRNQTNPCYNGTHSF